MQAMVVEEAAALREPVVAALRAKGFRVLAQADAASAREAARREVLDLLVLGRAGAGAAHDLALLAEWRNPLLATVLLTDREGPEADEVFQLLPSVQAVLGRRTAPALVAKVALEAAGSVAAEWPEERLRRRWAEAGGEPAPEIRNIFVEGTRVGSRAA